MDQNMRLTLQFTENIEPDVQLSPVTDPELLKQLEAEEKRGE